VTTMMTLLSIETARDVSRCLRHRMTSVIVTSVSMLSVVMTSACDVSQCD